MVMDSNRAMLLSMDGIMNAISRLDLSARPVVPTHPAESSSSFASTIPIRSVTRSYDYGEPPLTEEQLAVDRELEERQAERTEVWRQEQLRESLSRRDKQWTRDSEGNVIVLEMLPQHRRAVSNLGSDTPTEKYEPLEAAKSSTPSS